MVREQHPVKGEIVRTIPVIRRSGKPAKRGRAPVRPILEWVLVLTNGILPALVLTTAQVALAPVRDSGQPPDAIPKRCLEGRSPSSRESQLEDAIERRPTAAAFDSLGAAFAQEKQLGCAVAAFDAALRLDPQFSDAALNLAELSLSQSRYQAAIYYLRRASSMPPHGALLSRIEADLGVAYSKTGDHEDAVKAFRQAIAATPRNASLYFNLANVYAHQQDYGRAAEEYQKAVALDPSKLAALLSLAKALLVIHKVPQALPLALRYTGQKPNDFDGLDVLGQAYRELGKYPEAVAALRRAAGLSPSDYNAHYNLGVALARMGQNAEAARQLQVARKLKPDESAPLYDLGLIKSKTNHPNAARRDFQEFQEMKQRKDVRERAKVLNSQGNDDYAKGRIPQAVEDYRKSLKLDPTSPEVHYNLSLALARLGDEVGEKQELEQAERLDPKFPKAHNQLGLCDLREGKLGDAEREFRKALALLPTFAGAQNNLGVLLAREGKFNDAGSLFQQATANNPHYVQAYMNWGLVLAHQAKYEDAGRNLRLALGLCDDCAESAALHKSLGLIDARKGDTREALRELNLALKLNPADEEVRNTLRNLSAAHDSPGAANPPVAHP